jgi:hypothetical protein
VSDHHLIVTTGPRTDPGLLELAIADAADAVTTHVALPAVMPGAMPISAVPARLAERLNRLAERARAAADRRGLWTRVEIVPCRDVAWVVRTLAELEHPDQVTLVGTAGWRLRRALRGLDAETRVLAPQRQRLHRRGGPVAARGADTVQP